MTAASTISAIWTGEVINMAVRCRVGILNPFEQEIIMKGDQMVTIRRMLENKQFIFTAYKGRPTSWKHGRIINSDFASNILEKRELILEL